MLKLIVVAIFNLFLLVKNKRRKKGWINPSTFLIGIYCIVAILGIPHVLINGESNVAQYSLILSQGKYWIGSFAYILFLSLYLFPIYYFKENRTEEIIVPSISVLDVFSGILIIISLFSIFFYLPSVIKMFRSGTALRLLRINLDNTLAEYGNTGGTWNTIASVSSSMYPFAIMLFFIYYIFGNRPKRCVLLFISSTSNIIHVLSFVGRDGVVFWIIEFLVMYILFRNYLNKRQRRNIKKIVSIGVAFSIIPFIIISVSRFGDGNEKFGTLKSILAYLGQMVPNYLLYFDIKNQYYIYGTSFPLFWEIIRKEKPISMRWIDGGTESNVFGTFIKSYNINFGVIGTIIIGMIALLLFIIIFKREKKVICFHHYFIYILYFEVLSEGLFYFRQCTRGGNLFILICLGLYFLFNLIEDNMGRFKLRVREDMNIINKSKVKFVFRRN